MYSQLKTCSLDSSGFDFLSAVSAGRRDEHCSRDCAMSSIVHLSSGRACSSSVKGPCLVRVSSSTLAQEDSSMATKGERKTKDKWFSISFKYWSNIHDPVIQYFIGYNFANDRTRLRPLKTTSNVKLQLSNIIAKSLEIKKWLRSKITFNNWHNKLL